MNNPNIITIVSAAVRVTLRVTEPVAASGMPADARPRSLSVLPA